MLWHHLQNVSQIVIDIYLVRFRCLYYGIQDAHCLCAINRIAEQKVIPADRKGADMPFRCPIIYRNIPIFQKPAEIFLLISGIIQGIFQPITDQGIFAVYALCKCIVFLYQRSDGCFTLYPALFCGQVL